MRRVVCAVIAPPDLKREHGGAAGTMLGVRKVRMFCPYWDMALLEVECLDPAISTLKRSIEGARSMECREIALVATTGRGVPTDGSR